MKLTRFEGKLAPLPDDYYRRSEGAQRECRVNAVKLRETPEDVVNGWDFFRDFYLVPNDEFYKRRVPSPKIHYQWIHCMARMARNIFAAPRSFAKSIVVGQEFPLYWVLGDVPTEVLTVLSEQKKAIVRGNRFARMLTHNRLLVEDFGDLKGIPRREERLWSAQNLHLANGSKLTTSTIISRALGSRPDYIIWDDVEPDPHLRKEGAAQTVEDIVSALFDVYLPMLDAGTAMTIIGTLLHRRSFLYWAMTTTAQEMGFWNRILTAIVDSKGQPEWPEKFPLETIDRLKKSLGGAFWGACMNAPRSDADAILKRGKFRNGYLLEGADEEAVKKPLDSKAVVLSWRNDDPSANDMDQRWEPVRRRWGDEVRGMFRFLCVDYATDGGGDRKDFSCIHTMGLDRDDVLWSLDLWLGRTSLDKLKRLIWAFSEKWRVKLIGVEAIGPYQALYEEVVKERFVIDRRLGYCPRIKRVQYPHGMDKATRIMGLEPRFLSGKVKLPIHLENDPHYRHLLYQIDNFTVDLKNLRWDDAVDTLSMTPYAVEFRVHGRRVSEGDARRKTLVERLIAGETHDPKTGIPYITGVNASEVPISAFRKPTLTKPTFAGRVLAKLPLEWTMWDLANAVDAEVSASKFTGGSQ